jgi:hypothetical protein
MKGWARSLIETIPLGALPPSAMVDALLMAAGVKRAMRTRLARLGASAAVSEWCDLHRLAHRVDAESYVSIAVDQPLAALILKVDRQVEPHEAGLGRLLGYPACCIAFVAEEGEDRIDQLSAKAAQWPFRGDYRLIDPSLYLAGKSLICHVPCSSTCDPSLGMARAALDLVRVHRHSGGFRRWEVWFDASPKGEDLEDIKGLSTPAEHLPPPAGR